MKLLTTNKVLCSTLCLHLLVFLCLPWLTHAKPTLETPDDDTNDDGGDDDDNLKDRVAPLTENDEQNVQPQEVPADEHEGVRMDDVNQEIEEPQQQYGAGNVEEIVHGEGSVHDSTSQVADEKVEDDVKQEDSGTVDVEHIMHGSDDAHDSQQNQETQPSDSEHPLEFQQQPGPHDVEEMVHGQNDVNHMASPDDDDEGLSDGDFKREIGTDDVEHMTHESNNVHARHESLIDQENAVLDQQQQQQQQQLKLEEQEEFLAGNVEEIVHGKDEHVHDDSDDTKGQGHQKEAGQGQEHFSAGEEDVMKAAGTVNVHDPDQRVKFDTAGEILALTRGEGEGGEGEEGGGGRAPIVADTEHLMHGEGGHEFDVKRMKDLQRQAANKDLQDRFSDLHGIVMHDGKEQHDHDGDDNEDSKIARGKAVTYKDIMNLGLDEEFLKGIDLTKLLQENAREYDDWQRDKDVIRGESPEASFWEQIGELRKRYLSFGKSNGEAKDLTGTNLDPAQQKWVSDMGTGADGWQGEGDGDGRAEGEDSVMHSMEILGSTAPKKDRHKTHQHQHPKEGGYHVNGRDTTDL